MSVSKIPRKSGATTVKRDGKIVGNIGQGKAKVPTSHNNSIQKLDTTETDVLSTSTLADAQQKFDNLLQKSISFEQAQVLWNLTGGQNIVERLNILGNYIDNMSLDEKNRLVSHIGDEHCWSPSDFSLALQGKNPNGNINANILDAFAHYKSIQWRRSIAQNTSTLPKTLDILVNNKDSWILANIAKNPNVTTETIRKIFVKEADSIILDSIAENENTPQEILEKLSRGEQRKFVAINKSTSPKVLSILGLDSSLRVREGVAKNWNAPSDTLDILSTDTDIGIVWYVANNRNASYDTLNKLTNHADKFVAETALVNLNYTNYNSSEKVWRDKDVHH